MGNPSPLNDKHWIRIALENCPKCHNESIRVYMVIRSEWKGGEILKCTNCNQKGVIRIRRNEIRFRYFKRRRK